METLKHKNIDLTCDNCHPLPEFNKEGRPQYKRCAAPATTENKTLDVLLCPTCASKLASGSKLALSEHRGRLFQEKTIEQFLEECSKGKHGADAKYIYGQLSKGKKVYPLKMPSHLEAVRASKKAIDMKKINKAIANYEKGK